MSFSSKNIFEESAAAVVAAASSLNAGVQTLQGPLQQDVRDAADACWSFRTTTVQVGNKYLLQRKMVELMEAVVDEEAEESQLGCAVGDWLKSAEGPVVSTALELYVAEQRLLHAVHQTLKQAEERGMEECLSILAAVLTAHNQIAPHSTSVTAGTVALLQGLALQAGSLVASRDEPGGQKVSLAQALRPHVAGAPFAAALLQSEVQHLPQILLAILGKGEVAYRGDEAEDASSQILKGQALLLSQLPWGQVSSLAHTSVQCSVVEPLEGFGEVLLRRQDNPDPDWHEATSTLLKIFCDLGKATEELAHGSLLLMLLSLARKCGMQAIKKSIGIEDKGGVAKTEILQWAQIVWRCPTASMTAAALLTPQLPWLDITSHLLKAMRLRAVLALIAVAKAAGEGSAYTSWFWQLLEGPAGAKLTMIDSDCVADEAHVLCMTQAPESQPEVQALWMWLKLQLALNFIEYQSIGSWDKEASLQVDVGLAEEIGAVESLNNEGATAASLPQEAATMIAGESSYRRAKLPHVLGLQEAMQFWEGFEALVQGGHSRVAVGFLVRTYLLLRGINMLRSQLGHLADVLSSALEADTAKIPSLLRPIRDLVTSAVTAGVMAAEQPTAPKLPTAVTQKGHRAPAVRGSTVHPGRDALEMASDWAVILAICVSRRAHLAEAVAELLSDLTQLLFYHAKLQSKDTRDEGSAKHPDAFSMLTAGRIVDSVDPMAARRLCSALMEIPRVAAKEVQWLPLMACWISNVNDVSPAGFSTIKAPVNQPEPAFGATTTAAGVHVLQSSRQDGEGEVLGHSGQSSLNRNAEEALQIQEVAIALGYCGAALPLWSEFLSRYFAFQTQLQAVVPLVEISQHLAQLGQLYEFQSPLLAEIYTLMAPMSPELLPGEIFEDNPAALQALMQLHPLRLAAPQTRSHAAEPGTSETGDSGQPHASTIGIDDHHKQAQLNDAGDGQMMLVLPLPPVEASDVSHILEKQERLSTDLVSTKKDIQAWAANEVAASGEEKVPAHRIADSLPAPLATALNTLWVAQSKWTEEIDILQAELRELVQRRYRNVDLKDLEGEAGDDKRVAYLEVPGYEHKYTSNRQKALSAVTAYAGGKDLCEAASILFQVEAIMLGYQRNGEADYSVEIVNGALLDALTDAILDSGTPSICIPYLTALFQKVVKERLSRIRDTTGTTDQLVSRVVASLAVGSSGGCERHTEASVLLTSLLDSSALLTARNTAAWGRSLLTAVGGILRHPSLTPTAAANLLACFNCADFTTLLLARPELESGLPEYDFQVGESSGEAPPRHAAGLLSLCSVLFSISGGQTSGAEVATSILHYNSPASSSYPGVEGASSSRGSHLLFAAAVTICLIAWQSGSTKEALHPLLQIDLADLPLTAALDSIMQVSNSIQEGSAATSAIPYALLKTMIKCPSVILSLRGSISGTKPQLAEAGTHWTISFISASVERQPIADQTPDPAFSGLSAGTTPGSSLPEVLLKPVPVRTNTGEVLETLLGFCLQAILEKHGSGLEGIALTQEFNQLLALIIEPAAGNPWMVDWLWDLYKSHLRPFLSLAGEASGGAAISSFRHFWACLPWKRATFHTLSPDAVADLGSHLLNSDRAVLELLHALNWAPVLQQLANTSALDSLVARTACRWAVQLACLAVRVFILLSPSELPDWLQKMLEVGEMVDPGEEQMVRSLQEVLQELDSQGVAQLRGLLCSRISGVPFLLQPLVVSPTIVQGDPGPRLLHVSKLLTSAAQGVTLPQLAALAAATLRTVLFVSVCRTYGEAAEALLGPSEGFVSGGEAGECWQLTDSLHIEIAVGNILQLASQHASFKLSTTARGERHGGASLLSDVCSTPSLGATKWRPPELSQLAGRLGVSPLTPGSSLGAQHWGDLPATSPPRCRDDADKNDAAVPIVAYLDLLSDNAAEIIRTADPIPFANAREPMSLSEVSGGTSDDATVTTPEVNRLDLPSGGGHSFLQTSMSRFKQNLEGNSPKAPHTVKRQGGNARALQVRMAELLRNACKTKLELALSTLRVLLTSATLRKATIPSALQEALILDLAVTASGDPSLPASALHNPASLGSRIYEIFDGLGEGEMMGICYNASMGRTPLTQAVASQALLEKREVKELDKSAWRLLASEVVKMAAEAEARKDAPTHILSLWLATLPWVGDARWRSTQSSSSNVLEGLLDSMQRTADFVRQGGEDAEALDATDDRATFVSSAAERLRDLRATFQSKLKTDSGYPPDETPDPCVPSSEFSPRTQEALGLQQLGASQQPQTAKEKAGRKLMGLGKGLKNMVTKAGIKEQPGKAGATDQKRSGLFRKKEGPAIMPTVHSDSEAEAGGLSPEVFSSGSTKGSPFSMWRATATPHNLSDSPRATRNPLVTQPSGSSGSGSPGGGFFGRAKERIKRGLGQEKDRLAGMEGELEHAKELAALEESVALGLAAFAVQAYVKSVLCPSLSDYTPRAVAPRIRFAGTGLSSRQSSLGGGLDSHKSSLSALNNAVGIHRVNVSVGSALSTGAVLDEAAMRELDQLMEARTELDSLDEILSRPLIAANLPRWAPFFGATPQLLSSATTVEAFQKELISLLFPGSKYLNLNAFLLAIKQSQSPTGDS